MKKETKILSYNNILKKWLFSLLILSLVIQVHASSVPSKNKPQKEQFVTAELKLDFRPNVEIELFEHDATILPSKNNEIHIKVAYIAKGLEENEAAIVEKAMRENLIKKEGANIKISTRFYKHYSQISLGPLWGKTYMHLENGKKIAFEEFKYTKIEISLPSKMDLTIDSKYNKIRQKHSIQGDLTIDGYDMEYRLPGISGELKIDGKYSTYYIPEAGDATLNLYECKIRSDKLGKVNADAKYSSIRIASMQSLKFKAYEGELKVEKLKDALIDAKYVEIDLGEGHNIVVDLYEGHLNIENANKLEVNAKYLESQIGILGALEMSNGYENDFRIKKINSIKSKNGKYCQFEIEELTETAHLLSSYEDDLSIDNLSKTFKTIQTEGKYMVIKLGVERAANYYLQGNIQYHNFDFNQSDFSNIIHKEDGSKVNYKYLRGSSEEPSKTIELSGYEIDVIIDHK